MKKTALFLLVGALASSVMAKPFVVKENDNLRKILVSQQGKTITLNLKSGQSLTGKIGTINTNIVHVKRLKGMEFYDSVTSVDSIESIIVRTKD